MRALRTIRVFIASPGDLAVERRAFKDVIEELNQGFGRGADVMFEPLGWEDALATTGRRSQDVINGDVDACDVFVLAMLRRWGQKAPDAQRRGFTSYTEEEFYRALTRFEKTKSPAIFVFFKHIDAGEMASPGPDLKKVLKFRRKLEKSKQVLWRGFKDDAEFKAEVDRHLVAFAKGEVQQAASVIVESLLPESALTEIAKLRVLAERAEKRAAKAEKAAKGAAARAAAAERRAEAALAEKAIRLAESAARAALDGRIEEARQDFALALDGSTNLHVLSLGVDFFNRIGELDEAERLLRTWLSISGPSRQTAETAAAYVNLGTIEKSRGELDTAEKHHRRALAIYQKLESSNGIAVSLSNLGVIEALRGNDRAAEKYFRKALSLHKRHGSDEGMAVQYGNLGLLDRRRGNLDAAEKNHRMALSINRKIGREEGVASQYGNLGLIEEARRNPVKAESYHKRALKIEKKLGRREGEALTCASLGICYGMQGRTDEAKAFLTRARDLFRRLGATWRERAAQTELDALKLAGECS